MQRLFSTLLITAVALQAATAHAHFIFLKVVPAAAGPTAEVYFGEGPEADDPDLIGNIAHVKLWERAAAGGLKLLTVTKGEDRLTAPLTAAKTIQVVGACEYGVIARGTPFLLRYYAKALSGDPTEAGALPPSSELPLEVMSQFTADGVTVTVLYQGKPVPKAALTTVDKQGKTTKVEANEQGQLTWKLSEPGTYAVFAKHVVPTAGEFKGEKYSEIRAYSTLTFPFPLTAAK